VITRKPSSLGVRVVQDQPCESERVLPDNGTKRRERDLEGEQSPWKDRLLIGLATTRQQYGLVGGVKP